MPDTSLAEARQLNATFRAHLDQGLHPALFVPPQMARKAKAQKRNPDTPAPPDSPQHWTVKQYVEKWLKSDPNWSKNTIKTKSDRAHKYIVKPYGHMKLRDITHAVIEDCIRLLTEAEKHARQKKSTETGNNSTNTRSCTTKAYPMSPQIWADTARNV